MWPQLRRLFLGLGAVYLSLVPALAKLPEGVAIAPPPTWVKPVQPAAIATAQPNPSGQDFLLLDRQIHVAAAETYVRRVFQVVSDEGRRNSGQVQVNFDPSYQTLTLHHLRIVRGEQSFDRLDPRAIELLQRERDLDRQLYNGERSALIILPDLRVGDVIDLAFTTHGANPVFGGRFIDVVFLGWGVPVQELRCRVLTPAERTIYHQVRGEARPEFATHVTAEGREMIWVSRGMPALDADDRTPSAHPVYPFLELTEFATWREVVDWAVPLYAVATPPDPEVREIANQIRRSTPGEDERIVAALQFVQTEIRYLGIELGAGSHHPSDPATVLKRRFGDCKDKSRLLVAILRELGFDAAPALVHSHRWRSVAEWLPSPFAFDHVVVAVSHQGRTVILDPTLTYQRGETTELRHLGGYGPYLWIRPGNAALLSAPIGEGDVYQVQIDEFYEVFSIEAPARLWVETTYRGAAANQIRAWFATNTAEQVMRRYIEFYTRYYPELDANNTSLSHHDDPKTNVFTVNENYLIPHLFVPPKSGTVHKAEFYPAVLSDYVRIPNLQARRHPLSLNYPVAVTSEIRIQLPSPWLVEPTSQVIDDSAFRFAATVKIPDPKNIHLRYEWHSKEPEIPVARLPEFGARAKAALDLLGYQLMYNPAVAGAGGIMPPNWRMLGLTTLLTVLGGAAGWWLLRRRNPTPPPPPLLTTKKSNDAYSWSNRSRADAEGLGGWLVLVGIGLVIRPILQIVGINQGLRGYFNQAVWDVITSPTSEVYQPHYALAASIELTLSLVLLYWSLILLIQFFRRSYLFPRTIQWFLGFQLVAAAIMVWTSSLITSAEPEQITATAQALGQSVGAALIWIPYFQFSRRVKRTFVT